MRELTETEIDDINGGAAIMVAIGLWTILICGKDQLDDIGREIGAGLYDGLNS